MCKKDFQSKPTGTSFSYTYLKFDTNFKPD